VDDDAVLGLDCLIIGARGADDLHFGSRRSQAFGEHSGEDLGASDGLRRIWRRINGVDHKHAHGLANQMTEKNKWSLSEPHA